MHKINWTKQRRSKKHSKFERILENARQIQELKINWTRKRRSKNTLNSKELQNASQIQVLKINRTRKGRSKNTLKSKENLQNAHRSHRIHAELVETHQIQALLGFWPVCQLTRGHWETQLTFRDILHDLDMVSSLSVSLDLKCHTTGTSINYCIYPYYYLSID